jgi:hypothetical protein
MVHIITKYKITHYQYLILHNREFSSFGNRKNYFKSSTVRYGKVMMYEYIIVYIVLSLIIIIKIIDFFVGKKFFIFFSCTFKHPR